MSLCVLPYRRAMRALSSAVLLAIGLAAMSVEAGDFQKVSWGMSLAQVRAAYPSAKVELDGGTARVRVENTPIAGRQADLELRLEGGVLRAIEVTFYRSDRFAFVQLELGLRAKYGKPAERQRRPESELDMVRWHTSRSLVGLAVVGRPRDESSLDAVRGYTVQLSYRDRRSEQAQIKDFARVAQEEL